MVASGGGRLPIEKGQIMAKGQKRSTREVRKPKADAPKKANASAPTMKSRGLGPKP
jgi:hypothetical protein